MRRRHLVVLAPFTMTMTLLACGGTDGSFFGGDGKGKEAVGDPGSGQIGDTQTDPIGTNAACVTSTANASLPAVNLVLMYDKSGSMGDPKEGGDPNVKWIPVNAGMKAFFTDPASAGYNASLQFFPAPGDVSQTCGAPYATPLVPLTPLSSAGPLVAALEAASPQGGTPTLPALTGAITYAQATQKAYPEETTAVVLVTDGEPGMMVDGSLGPGCKNNDIPHVAQAAAAAFGASPSLRTYVIGVGQQLGSLNQIAQAGGTQAAHMIALSDPTSTRLDLQKALESIRSQVKVACDFAIPPPPKGQEIDKTRVNVAFTSGAGHETPLVYSGDCSRADGWRYDDISAPTRIELCGSACTTAQADPNGRITIGFGCLTVQAPK